MQVHAHEEGGEGATQGSQVATSPPTFAHQAQSSCVWMLCQLITRGMGG